MRNDQKEKTFCKKKKKNYWPVYWLNFRGITSLVWKKKVGTFVQWKKQLALTCMNVKVASLQVA